MRSSSYNAWDYCAHQYFIDYVLGFKQDAGKGALKGTICHKVFECLALIKKEIQDKKHIKPFVFTESVVGNILVNPTKILEPKALTTGEIEGINKSRKNKWKYQHPCMLEKHHVRYGIDLVEELISKSYQYYADNTWYPADRKDCANWVWMGLEYENGAFDPRRRNIVAAEPHFNIEIDKDWARYRYDIDGKKISGNLCIKGTIDLVTDIGDGIYEIIDFKTGQRLNWATGEKKDYKKLEHDFQLMLYYYAAKNLFPDAEQIIVTIYFVRSGGPFTLLFDEDTVKEVEEKLCLRFHEIKECTVPELLDYKQKDFRCSKLCGYYKEKMKGSNQNICHFIHNQILSTSIDEVTKKYQKEGFNVDEYESPGE